MFECVEILSASPNRLFKYLQFYYGYEDILSGWPEKFYLGL